MKIEEAAEAFMSSKRFAVTGVSRTSEGHGSNVVYQRLKERGYDVVAINPNADRVEGDPCYPNLSAVPGGVDAVVIGTSPEHALATTQEAAALGISKVWMHRSFGTGSVSEEATKFGRAHGILMIDGGCPLMFGNPSDGGHRVMCAFMKLTGKVPRVIETPTAAE